MPYLTIDMGDHLYRAAFSCGPSLREILDLLDFRVRSGCRGDGSCGLCLIQVLSGEVDPLTRNERLMLEQQHQEDRSIRLACQVVPRNDLTIRIVNPAPKSHWRSLPSRRLSLEREDLRISPVQAYGVAVDLGTTHLSVALWDLRLGKEVAGLVGLNPQIRYGSDVITRLLAAAESPGNTHKLANAAADGIAEALWDICSRQCIDTKEIVHVSIVGNTPMLALLTENEPQALLNPDSWNKKTDCRLKNPQSWIESLGLNPEASVETVSPLAGFVGSDLLAGVLVTRVTDHPRSLLIDFGTNSEMALWDGRTLWATSAAGGPAFEGCGISCGMPAESGAIYRISAKPDSSEIEYGVIDDGEAKGVCGSGMVDLIAYLLRTGRLTDLGKFAAQFPDGFHLNGFHRDSSGPAIRLDGKGVDVFQRAKAAIGVGTRVLLETAGLKMNDLERVCVCGAFGQHLDIPNAQAIGLLPVIPAGRIELCGNTALTGCELLFLSRRAPRQLQFLRERARMFNLAQVPEFDELFMECLYLRPLEANQL